MAKRSGCPVCGGAPVAPHSPFCGQGCRDRDLLRWLDGGYRLPGHPADAAALPDGLDTPGEPR